MSHESIHHMQWPKKDYSGKHERHLRGQLVVPTLWGLHRELHGQMEEPPHPDIGITLTLIDYLNEKQPSREDAPLYAIDRLNKLRSQEALDLSAHFVRQLGYLGVNHG